MWYVLKHLITKSTYYEKTFSHSIGIDDIIFSVYLDFSDKIYESKEFSEFNKNVRYLRCPVANISDTVIRIYNLPK